MSGGLARLVKLLGPAWVDPRHRVDNRDGKVILELPSRLLTLPQVAEIVGVEYRTLHTWLKRGLLRPSAQQSSGIGVPNLFSTEDLIHARVIADLRQSGLSFERLREAAAELDEHPGALTTGHPCSSTERSRWSRKIRPARR